MPEGRYSFGKRSAQLLSVVFQPIFIPFYTMLLLFNAETFITYAISPEVRQFVYGVVLINAIMLPTAVFLFLIRKGVIQSMHMHTAAERTIPFLTVIVFQLSTYALFLKLPMPSLIPDLVLAGVISVGVALVINLRWKVSIHMLGMGGLVGTFIGLAVRYQVDAQHLLMALIVLSGLVGYARLRLNAHTPAQVYVGFMIGVAILSGAIMVL
ncbi:MAG: phosphatase PAP2 family protein [Flavobacteriales bacterium]|nr:phosphatase PAP2 family protein [Flavobacteriales bacterium]